MIVAIIDLADKRLMPQIPWPLVQPLPIFVPMPTLKSIDKNLIVGSGTFGIGWGMVGFCPGPAISSLALLNTYSVFFVLSMLGGFLLTELVTRTIIKLDTN